MKFVLSDIEDIKKYNPYVDLSHVMDAEDFEGKFLEYIQNFQVQVEQLKERLNHKYDKKIDGLFENVIKQRNDEEINKIFNNYYVLINNGISKYSKIIEYNEQNIVKLKSDIRRIKDIILMIESSNMRRLQVIDNRMGDLIDEVTSSLGITPDKRNDEAVVSELIESFKGMDAEGFKNASIILRAVIKDVCDYYRRNFSIKTSTKNIRKLNLEVDKLIDGRASELNIVSDDKKLIFELVEKYNNKELTSENYDEWIDKFNKEIEELKTGFENVYSDKMANKFIELLDKETGELKDKKAKSLNLSKIYSNKLYELFDSYKPEEIDNFDEMFYSSKEECDKARVEYHAMTLEEKKVFEMRIYEQYIRFFKGKIRELNKEFRRVYSIGRANLLVDFVNKNADKYIRNKAKEIGKPVPKNPWFVRKYLWADSDNFMSKRGLAFRKFINPFLRVLVRVAMKNKLIIEERPELDSTKQYIFVSTHYFTEDVIGLFSSIGRQAYMLMGTTDQIENNPLMVAAACFGFFHVDRMDSMNRKECLEKQNRIIENGTNFINYVSGSWENSENELQPLSFSGPYRTSKKMNAQIVPLASYLVREKKKMYVRYGEPLDLSSCDEDTANMIIRDTLASMHFKQMSKHCVPIETIKIDGYGKTHNLPYNQHIYYMDQIGNEYWNQPWSKPFAKEEIGVRPSKESSIEDVYSFIDNLSRENLIKLSGVLSEPMVRRYERDDRYNIVKYLDSNYDKFKKNSGKKKVRVRNEKR